MTPRPTTEELEELRVQLLACLENFKSKQGSVSQVQDVKILTNALRTVEGMLAEQCEDESNILGADEEISDEPSGQDRKPDFLP
jgi:hypothetical protein